MRLLNRLTGKIGAGVLTTEHSASSYGQPVLLVAGEAYGTADAVLFFACGVSAEEAVALLDAGYGAVLAEGGVYDAVCRKAGGS